MHAAGAEAVVLPRSPCTTDKHACTRQIRLCGGGGGGGGGVQELRAYLDRYFSRAEGVPT